jgi:hypothetical protein
LFLRDNASGEVRQYRARSASFHWTSDGRRLIYASDTSGTENAHVYMLDTHDPRRAGRPDPLSWVRAGIHQIAAADPSHVLVFHNRRDPSCSTSIRIDLETRKETLSRAIPATASAPITERDGSFKGWKKPRDAQRTPRAAARAARGRRPMLVKKPDETFQVTGTSADGSLMWALSDRGRDRVALVAAHPTLGWERVCSTTPTPMSPASR